MHKGGLQCTVVNKYCIFNPIQTGLFVSLPATGGGLQRPPAITSKPLMLWPPKLHRKMYLSFPTFGDNLVDTMT